MRGFMEMVAFRMAHQFQMNYERHKEQKEIVDTKVKMNMIHEAFFTILHFLLRVWILRF